MNSFAFFNESNHCIKDYLNSPLQVENSNFSRDYLNSTFLSKISTPSPPNHR